jgi:hypothetical protein
MTSGSIDLGAICSRAVAEIALSEKRCATKAGMPIEPWGRGSSRANASRSLFAVDFELGAFHYWDGGI